MPNNVTFEPLDFSFTIQLQMISDWHIGSGAGRPGDVDRLVRRDDDGLPFIPAKTIIGIWRDACERAALGLDNGKAMKTGWSAWIPFLFGDQPGQPDEEALPTPKDRMELPRAAALCVRAAHLPETLRDAIKAQPAVRDALTFVKPGIAIDPRTGRAKNDFLRFEEMARGRATLTAECRINWDDYKWDYENQKLAATALLLAGAKLVERIGAKRRRGAGQCEMTIGEGIDLNVCWNWIEALSGSDPPLPPSVEQSQQPAQQAASEAHGWAYVDLMIETKSPVIVSEQTIGNLVKTLDYIPGAYLLPIIRRKLNDKIDVNNAIFGGGLIVTNATVEVGNGAGRPTPLALYHEKVGGGLKFGRGVYNRLQEAAPAAPQLKGHRFGYIGVSPVKDDLLPDFKTVKLEVEPHNVVQDQFQRPTEVVGGVYSYQVIAKGAKLRAQLRVRKSVLPKGDENWFGALNGDHAIGRSKKDDYGAVCFKASKVEPKETEHEIKNELSVWLLSDLLLRDERLRPRASIHRLAKVLGTELGISLQPRDASGQKLMSAVSRQHRTDSWHVGWGLPRPSLVGFAAGTCFMFTIQDSLDPGKLNELEKALSKVAAEGLGERCAEGYGQLCFNDPLLATSAKVRQRIDASKPDETLPKKPVKKQGTAEVDARFAYAHLIEREAARKELQRCAIAIAAQPEQRKRMLGIFVKPAEKGGRAESQPPLSQLGALRSIVSGLKSDADDRQRSIQKTQVVRWLDRILSSANRVEKWPAGERGEDHSLHRIRDLITNPESVWAGLQADFERIELTENGARSLKIELWAEGVRAVVDACVRAQKRDTEPKSKGGETNGASN